MDMDMFTDMLVTVPLDIQRNGLLNKDLSSRRPDGAPS